MANKTLVWDEDNRRWVPLKSGPGSGGTVSPSNIVPQGHGSGLDADTVDGQHASAFAPASHTHPDATTTDSGFMSASDKAKLDGIEAGAQVNAPAYGIVRVDATDIVASVPSDTLEIAASDNITVTPDTTNRKVTIGLSSGPGSNLDADLLDGYHASDFALASHSHSLNILRTSGSATVSGSTSSPTQLATLTITPGDWLILGIIHAIAISTTATTFYGYLVSGATTLQSHSFASNTSTSGGITLVLSGLTTVTANTAIYLRAATSNTSYTYSAIGTIIAIRYSPV